MTTDVLRHGAARARMLPRVALLEREPYLVAIVALYAFALTAFAPWELLQDSWMTLVSGREIVQHGLPAHDSLTIVTHGARWVDQQWLAQLAFYGLFALGGLKAVLLVHVLAVAAGYGVAVAAARALGASQRSTFWIAAGALLLAPLAWQLRAQSLAYVPFACVLWLLAADSRAPSRRVLLVLPVLAVWGNLHGSVVVGVALVVLRGLTRRSPLLVLGAALAALASPYGASLAGYYRHMLVAPALFARLGGEWQPPTFAGVFAPFFVAAFVAVWLVARSGRALTVFERIALLGSIVGGLAAIRSITWFVLAVMILLPRALDEARPVRVPAGNGVAIRVTAYAAAAAVMVALAALLVVPATRFETGRPDAAAQTIARYPAARVLATKETADWLLWKVPSLRGRVAFDVRFELASTDALTAIADYRTQHGLHWLRLARGYDIVVLNGNADRSAARALAAAGWSRTLFADSRVTVLARASRPSSLLHEKTSHLRGF